MSTQWTSMRWVSEWMRLRLRSYSQHCCLREKYMQTIDNNIKQDEQVTIWGVDTQCWYQTATWKLYRQNIVPKRAVDLCSNLETGGLAGKLTGRGGEWRGPQEKREGSMTFREEDESNRARWLTWQAVQEKLKGGGYFYLHLECLLVSI